MISEKQITNISKLLSLVLRHEPSHIGISLDEQGWTDVSLLISKIQEKGIEFNFEILQYIVESNNKKRFALNYDSTKIRANQGHSIEVNLDFKATTPPDILFHGTATKFIESIQKEGLLKQNRLHVHLSSDENTALKVGQRHGKPILLQVKAVEMMQTGHEFYLSDNNVWLTDNVPLKYIIF